MNIFYVRPEHITDRYVELTGQEAVHAARVLRHQPGDQITVVDGQGGWYEGQIRQVSKQSVLVNVEKADHIPPPKPQLLLALGILKKRDRLEFAVEKAVELGASAIALFRSEHTIKEKVRLDRLESVALSAMKQSLRAWLPEVCIYHSLQEVLSHHSDCTLLAAHEKTDEVPGIPESLKQHDKLLLLVGPEGGFSEEEISIVMRNQGHLISLGASRLRAETAATVFLSQFI